MGIKFRHKGLKLLYEREDRSKIRADIVDKVDRFLTVLSQAEMPADVDLPGYSLHELKGNLKGYWSATISRNYRIIFRFGPNGPEDVDLVDYH
jgi:proteic killer suppression protein